MKKKSVNSIEKQVLFKVGPTFKNEGGNGIYAAWRFTGGDGECRQK